MVISAPLRRGLVSLIAVILVASSLVGIGQAASAAVPICNSVGNVWNHQGGNEEDWTAVWYPNLNGDVNCDFRQDETWNNPAVSNLQQTLNACYGPNAVNHGHHGGTTQQLTTEGKYGPRTQAAVKDFQRWWNARNDPDLTVDGYAGPTTRSKMKWVSNGLYGAKCVNVPYGPTPARVAPGAPRQYVSGNNPACLDGLLREYSLHGYKVELWSNGCTAAAQAVAHVPAGSTAVLTIDRTTFASPDSCGENINCYLKSWEIGENRTENPRYTYWDRNVWQTGKLKTDYVDGYRRYVRPCLSMHGYFQCGNTWVADTDK